jgi:uncharacterized membrane protein
MSIDITVETTIGRPAEEVAWFAMDPANDPVWIGGISEARMITDGPLAAGSRVARVASFLGKRIEYVNEIDELAPGERLVMHSVAGPFPMRITYEFAGREGGTVARIRVEGDAGGFYGVAGPLLRRKVRRSVAGDLATLKGLLERRADSA